MRVGEVAKRAGVNTQTIRYYEREGVLPPASRTASGYRSFSDDAVRVVRFTKRAQELGFSLEEIKELLRLRSARQTDCDSVKGLAEHKLMVISEKIADLTRMKRTLDELIKRCAGANDEPSCPILECLEPVSSDFPD